MKQKLELKQLGSALIIAAIAFIFVIQWGPGSRGCEAPVGKTPTSVAATVNGHDIPIREFQRTYANQLNFWRSQGNPIPDQLARQLGLPGQVMDQLINTELLAQAAERHSVMPSDAELADLIRSNPDFQTDGKFDKTRYSEVVTGYMRKTIPEFEADLRRRLAAAKMMDLVESGAVVSADEVKAKFLKDGNKADLTYVRFLPSMFVDKAGTVSPAEIAAFKKDHAKEISDFYDANKFLYSQPEKVHARHILIKVDKGATPEAKEAAKKKIEALRAEIEGGKDFAAVAKANSEDPGSKDSGGDLGFNDRTAWVPEFSKAAFDLKPGEMSQPVETQFGYHLIKVEEKRPEEKKTLADAQEDIAKQLIQKGKAKELAKAAADKALADAKAGKKLSATFPPEKENQPAALRFETETRPEAVSTGEFAASAGAIPHLGPAPELVEAVFAQKGPAVLDRVFNVGDNFVIAEVSERKLPSDQEFAAQSDKLLSEARKAKEVELRQTFLESLKKTASISKNQELLAKTETE